MKPTKKNIREPWNWQPTRRERIKQMRRDADIFGWDFVKSYLDGMRRAGCAPFIPER